MATAGLPFTTNCKVVGRPDLSTALIVSAMIVIGSFGSRGVTRRIASVTTDEMIPSNMSEMSISISVDPRDNDNLKGLVMRSAERCRWPAVARQR